MTSVKSSADTFLFTYARTIKKAFLAPLGLLIMLIAMFSDVFSEISEYKYNLVNTKGFDGEAYLAARKFIIFCEDRSLYGFSSILTQFFIIAVALVLAGAIFRFISVKKMVNVFYSIGMTRENMFLAKYLAGATLLFIAVLVPVLVSLCGNLYLFGSSKELYASLLYYFLDYYITAMFCYTVSTAIMTCVGSVIESSICSGVLVAAPTIIGYAVKQLLNAFLYGSPYGDYYYLLGSGSQHAETYSLLKLLNPLTTLVDGENNGAYSYVLEDVSNLTSHSWEAPSFTHSIIWGIVTVVIFGIAILLFKRRKAEYAGFLGVCRPITVASIFTLGLFASSYLIKQVATGVGTKNMLAIILLGGCGFMFAFYTLAKLILFRSFGAYFKKIYLVLPYCAVYVALCLVFTTGLFGYSAKVPDVGDVKSVSVSTGTANNIVYMFNSGITNLRYESDSSETKELTETGINAMRAVTLNTYSTTVVPGFTDKGDIETAIKAHEILIGIKNINFDEDYINSAEFKDVPVLSTAYFRYELNDGSVLERKYDYVTNEVLSLLASLQNSKVYTDYMCKKLGAEGLAATNENSVNVEGNGEIEYKIFDDASALFSMNYSVGFISANLLSRTPNGELTNDVVLRREMVEAIEQDVAAGRAHTDLKSDKPAIGFISVYDTYAEFEKPAVFGVDSEKSFHTSGAYGLETFPIYEDMTSTVKFLTDNNFIGYFENAEQPVSARICKINNLDADTAELYRRYSYNTTSQIAGCVNYETGEQNFVFAPNAKQYTDASQVKQIADSTNYSCCSAEEGYYVELAYADGTLAYGYIYSQDLPQ